MYLYITVNFKFYLCVTYISHGEKDI